MNILEANDETFNALADSPLVLVDFHAPWCAPCRSFAPVLKAFADGNPGLRVLKVNVDEATAVSSGFHVRSIPHLVVMRNGNIVGEKSGQMSPAQLQAFIASTVGEQMPLL